MKKVAMKMPVKTNSAADQWVNARTPDVSEAEPTAPAKVVALHEAETMKRFTIDVTESLHKRIKMQCVARGAKMADVIREMLEREFPDAKA